MIRGCERRIYHVKNPESDIFDEAYFVLRRGYEPSSAVGRRAALDEEVRRLVSGEGLPEPDLRPRLPGRIAAFVAGAAVSAVVVTLVLLVLR